MTQVLLFHHVHGLTDGVREFADRLAAGRHTVHTPDLYSGRVAASLEEGFAIKNSIGQATIETRIAAAVEPLPHNLVYAGISLGVPSAQRLAQTRVGASGALLYEACIPITGEWAFGPWPTGVPVQIHGHDDDEFFAHEGDLEAARELVRTVSPDLATVYTYPGSTHLFCDSSLPHFDPEQTAQLIERSLALLDRLD